ncbi:IS66 family insertion sequence element accessory protein TnpB [Sorangium sp. So ce367]|uniref:IS66 family insertion sequence element accessory protein TnpA n=1 Tax=Sorangium sp. So ce367 TaxID=3133305 RepID=UPI003F5DF018
MICVFVPTADRTRARSGLSAAKFDRRERYKPKQPYWWRWRLRADQPSAALAVVFDRSTAFFGGPRGDGRIGRRAGEPIEIALPNGRAVRVRPGFDPATLKRDLAFATEETWC